MTLPENCPHCGRQLVRYDIYGYTVRKCTRFHEDGDPHFFSVYDSREGYGGLGDHGKPNEGMWDNVLRPVGSIKTNPFSEP